MKASGQEPPTGIPSLGVFPHTPSMFLEKTNIQPLPGLWIQTLALCGGEPHQIQLVALNLPHKLRHLLFQSQPLLPMSGPSSYYHRHSCGSGERMCHVAFSGCASPTGTLSRVGFRQTPPNFLRAEYVENDNGSIKKKNRLRFYVAVTNRKKDELLHDMKTGATKFP